MCWLNRSNKKKRDELVQYLKQIRTYEDKAFEHLALDQIEKAIKSYEKIFEHPKPSSISSDDVISQKLNDKFSRIRLKLEALKSRTKHT
jgi:hypothetical protein